MSDLGQKQEMFSILIARLILYAYKCGYKIRRGDWFARSGHKDNSLHYIGLAIDLNLFKDGKYLDKTEDHKDLGKYWEELGKKIGVKTCWGGHFGDGNHYSIEHNGVK